jgi:hypothetical protein
MPCIIVSLPYSMQILFSPFVIEHTSILTPFSYSFVVISTMSRPVQTHVSYSAIMAITREPADPFRVGRLEFVGSTIHVPSDHVHNLLPMDTDFHITYWNDSQNVVDVDDLLVQDRAIICFGFFNWDVIQQKLQLKADFIIP